MPSTKITQQLGRQAEQVAATYLQEHGFQILAKNYRYQKAEIDLIVQKDSNLVFVEVKARTSQRFGHPENFMMDRQKALIKEAAENYILTTNWTGTIRFDIIAILKQAKYEQLSHFEDAF